MAIDGAGQLTDTRPHVEVASLSAKGPTPLIVVVEGLARLMPNNLGLHPMASA